MKLAVYGTLRKGYGLNSYLSEGKFIGMFRLNNFNLYMSGGLPTIKEGKESVVVEVYEITEDLLQILDRVEGVSSGFYKRKLVKINDFDVYVYVGGYSFNENDCRLVEDGDFTKNRYI